MQTTFDRKTCSDNRMSEYITSQTIPGRKPQTSKVPTNTILQFLHKNKYYCDI